MASVSTLSLFWPVFFPVSTVGIAYLGRALVRVDWVRFFTGPGRLSRILLLFFVLTNWKGMPLVWTVRVFNAFVRHTLFRPPAPLGPRALFHYSITASRTPLLETDYNMHKSNATYFSDLDVARSHLVTHLLQPGMGQLVRNDQTRLVRDKDDKVIRGAFGIGLGAVFCSFRKEIAPYRGYEMWTRVLSWDRKWLYLVTHFVVAGKVKPASWDSPAGWGLGRRSHAAKRAGGSGQEANGAAVAPAAPGALPAELEKYVIATAISKYVFKLGRFTVHPAILLESSGLLPERTGAGWRGGESGVGTPDELGETDDGIDGWTWQRVERERRQGMQFAEHFAALDGMGSLFDGGRDGALGTFGLG